MSSSVYLYITIIGIICLIFSMSKWKASVYFFFFWLVFEGAFRKWFFPGLEKPIFFIKYFIITGPFIRCFFMRNDYKHFFMPFLFLYIAWGLIEFSNWTVTNDVRVFILGFIIHFWYISFIIIIPNIFDHKEKIIRFFKIFSIVVSPILLLGIIQYSLPTNHVLNRYVEEEANVSGVGDKARITGTFSYIAPYCSFLRIYLIVVLTLILSRQKRWFTYFSYFLIALIGLNSLMTGSRGVVLAFIFSVGVFAVLSFSPKNKNWGKFIVNICFAILVMIGILLFTKVGEESVEKIEHRFSKTQELQGRILNLLSIPSLQNTGLMGYGIGTAYQGSQAFVNIRAELDIAYESDEERIIIELGLIGYSIYKILFLAILIWAWYQYFKMQNYNYKLFIIFALVNINLGFITGVTYRFFENVFFWFSVALIISVIKIDRRERLLLHTKRIQMVQLFNARNCKGQN